MTTPHTPHPTPFPNSHTPHPTPHTLPHAQFQFQNLVQGFFRHDQYGNSSPKT
ncbi:MAG: hypothetical protein F6J93_24185 [Oscillatoria sp. SIO1A7]|nr:hypothetical protein [Oscillatoria sp. SIO1A7]